MSARTEMTQCKDSIVILRRSEDRRRICMLTIQMFDCTSFVFFLLARHSPQAAFGSQGKRFFTSFRMTKGLGFGRSLRGTPGDSRMFAGLRGARLRPARLFEPHDAMAIVAKTIVPHPPRHSSERLLYSACYGLPHRVVGSLGQRRRSRLCVGFFVLCVGAFERCPVASRCGHGGSVVRLQPFVRFSRALRPSICSCF